MYKLRIEYHKKNKHYFYEQKSTNKLKTNWHLSFNVKINSYNNDNYYFLTALEHQHLQYQIQGVPPQTDPHLVHFVQKTE